MYSGVARFAVPSPQCVFSHYRDITGSSLVLRVHHIAGSSPSWYSGLDAIVVLRVRRNSHITGSLYYRFVVVYKAGSSVIVLRVRHYRRIAGSSMSSNCEFTNYRVAGSSVILRVLCGFFRHSMGSLLLLCYEFCICVI